jgi:hypothetical protein
LFLAGVKNVCFSIKKEKKSKIDCFDLSLSSIQV